MQIVLNPGVTKIVNAAIASGAYSNAGDCVNDIILYHDKLKLHRLRHEIQTGLDELNQGKGVELDMAKINEELDKEFGYLDA